MPGSPTKLGKAYAFLCDESVNWNAAAHRVDSLPHYGIEIGEEEGSNPKLDIKFENVGVTVGDLVDGTDRILLSMDRLDASGAYVDTLLLFDGRLDDSGEMDYADEDLTLRYVAIRDDWEVLRNNVLATIGLPYADPCAGDISKPDERLDALPSLVHWSRTTRLPALSSILGNGVYRNVQGRVYQGTVRPVRKFKPLARVDVVISAEWTENDLGEFDAGAEIRRVANSSTALTVIGTMTPKQLLDKWPKVGSSMPGGYTVTRSGLYEANAPDGQPSVLNYTQQGHVRRGYKASADDDPPDQPVAFPVHWFEPELFVAASNACKRREEVRLSVYNGGQGSWTEVEQPIEIKLDNLASTLEIADFQPNTHYGQGAIVMFAGFPWQCSAAYDSGASLWEDRVYYEYAAGLGNRPRTRWTLIASDGSALGGPGATTFFQTERGRKSIDHGILAAISRLAFSQRNWDVSFEADLFEFLDVSCRDVVTVKSTRIPSKDNQATGKVKSYTITINAKQASIQVNLGVSTGSGQAGGSGGRVVSPYTEAMFRCSYAPPAFLVPYAPRLGVSGVLVSNPAQSQDQALQQASAAGSEDLADVLEDIPTAIEIGLSPASGGETNLVMTVGVTAYQGYRGMLVE